MPLRFLLGAVVLGGLAWAADDFFSDWRKRQVLASFEDGRRRAGGTVQECNRHGHPLTWFCREGFYFQNAVNDLARGLSIEQVLARQRLRLEDGSIDTQIRAVAFGMGLSRSGFRIGDVYVHMADLPFVFDYVADGWAFDRALKDGSAAANEDCRVTLPSEFWIICEWGIGRAKFFRAENRASFSSVGTSGGFEFARRFTGSSFLPTRDLPASIEECARNRHVSRCWEF